MLSLLMLKIFDFFLWLLLEPAGKITLFILFFIFCVITALIFYLTRDIE